MSSDVNVSTGDLLNRMLADLAAAPFAPQDGPARSFRQIWRDAVDPGKQMEAAAPEINTDAIELKESLFAQEPRRSIPILALEEMSAMKAERDAAIARAEAAERQLAEMTLDLNLCRDWWRIANERLAERDASARRWVRLGCVLALLLPLTAHAADAPPTPPQPTLEQQVNADEATIMTARTKEAAIVDTWRSAIVSLGNQRDILQAQVTVISKERDALKDELAKTKAEPPANLDAAAPFCIDKDGHHHPAVKCSANETIVTPAPPVEPPKDKPGG